MITQFGKRFLANYIAGNSEFDSKAMALGIATTVEYPLLATNSRLGFEFYRVPIRQGGIDVKTVSGVTTYTVIYSATIPTNIAGNINEIGIYPGQSYSRNMYDGKFLSNFELPYEWSPEPSLDQTNYRIGDSSLIFASNSTAAREYTYNVDSMDVSGYNPLDTLCFSYKANANLSSLKVRLYSADSNYIEFTFTGHSVGYNLKTLNMSSGISTGTFNSESVTKIGIIVTPTSGQTTSVSVDGLRINDEDTFDSEYGLIARSLLDSTMIKVIGREATIEFKLDLSFGV